MQISFALSKKNYVFSEIFSLLAGEKLDFNLEFLEPNVMFVLQTGKGNKEKAFELWSDNMWAEVFADILNHSEKKTSQLLILQFFLLIL